MALFGKPKYSTVAVKRKDIPKGFVYAPVQFAPEPPPQPPMQVSDDFEGTAVGQPPHDAQANTEGKGDSILVTDETAAAGKHSLKILDAPGLQYIYNPHLVYIPTHHAGTTTLSYDMRLQAGVILYNEWRSWDQEPYRTGPTFWIKAGKLQLGGKDVMDLPTDQWFHVEVAAKVGANADGKWTLSVTLAGQEAKEFADLGGADPTFKNLTWVGWSSNAQEKVAFYLDNVKLVNSEFREE